jgi:hypothetical protein
MKAQSIALLVATSQPMGRKENHMRIGIDFPSMFAKDNFTTRRTTGHNWYDPESLITGEEIKVGFTPANSTRNYLSEAHYHACVSQQLSPETIALTAPRVYREELQRTEPECPAVQRFWEANSQRNIQKAYGVTAQRTGVNFGLV